MMSVGTEIAVALLQIMQAHCVVKKAGILLTTWATEE